MIKLLLVEDSDQWAGLLKDELEALENYQVSVAYNGNEGLKMWKELSPDIIVTGVDMPMMNGRKRSVAPPAPDSAMRSMAFRRSSGDGTPFSITRAFAASFVMMENLKFQFF